MCWDVDKFMHANVSCAGTCPAGSMPKKFSSQEVPSYARLVNFVTERLWDYDSCEEAQLKIWLARHLLATENTGEAGLCLHGFQEKGEGKKVEGKSIMLFCCYSLLAGVAPAGQQGHSRACSCTSASHQVP